MGEYWGLPGEVPVTMPVLARASGVPYKHLRMLVHRDHDRLPCMWAGKVAKIRPRVFWEFLEREERRDGFVVKAV